MIKWFNKLSTTNKIAVVAIIISVIVGIIGGAINLIIKEKASTIKQNSIHQEGTGNTAIVAEGNRGTTNTAGRDIYTGIESEEALKILVETSAKLGRSEKENELLKERIKQLETQLAQPLLKINIASEQSVPVPSKEAKELAELINENDGPYAQALKAIADGNSEQADEFLDQTQQLIDNVQQQKGQAQAKIYFARMQNAFYYGRYQDALVWCEKLHLLVGNDPQTLNLMGVVYHQNAKYTEAESLFQRALAICENALGKDHPNVAIVLNNLALLYKDQGRYAEAEPLFQRALTIGEKVLGKDHLDVAIALNNLALLYKAQGRYAEAEPLYQRALAISEKALGKDRPDVVMFLNNLAELYCTQGKYVEAEHLFQRALAICENALGKDHPNVAIVLNNLAGLYYDQRKYAEAEPLYRRALIIKEKTFGKDHPDIAMVLKNLAGLYCDQCKYAEAEPLYKRAVEITEKCLGPNHPKTIAYRKSWDECRSKM